MLVEGGLAKFSQQILKDLVQVVSDLSCVSHWFITHSHYDHVGGLPQLLKHLPSVEVFASQAVVDALKRPSVVRLISKLNHFDGRSDVVPYRDIQVFQLNELEPLCLTDNLTLKVIACPGHSRCSTAIFLEEKSFLFVSDCLGEMVTPQKWLPLVFDSPVNYEKSIRLIADLPYEYLALGHYGCLSGREAREAPIHALKSYCEFRKYHKNALKSGVPRDIWVDEIIKEYATKSQSFVEGFLFRSSVERMYDLFERDNRG